MMTEKEGMTMIDWTGKSERNCISLNQKRELERALQKQDNINKLRSGRLPTREEVDSFRDYLKNKGINDKDMIMGIKRLYRFMLGNNIDFNEALKEIDVFISSI